MSTNNQNSILFLDVTKETEGGKIKEKRSKKKREREI